MLLKPRQGGYKKDILLIFTELFMKLNILANNIEIVSIRLENEHSFSNRDEYVALKSPENMLGIQALWDIVLKGKDDNIAKEVANFITAGLYTRPELDKVDRNDGYIDYMKELIDKVIYLIREEEKKEGFETDKDAQRVIGLPLSMLSDFIDTSESREIVKNVSLSSFYKGKNGVMTIENKISPTFNTPKSIDIKVAGNTTVQQIKQMVSKEIKKTTWKNVKLLKGYRKVEIPDKCNTRNVRDLGISLGDRIYSEYRSAPVLKQEPLLLGDMTNTYINPKAIKAFKRIFYTYAKDARLGPEQLVKYTEVVLDEKNLSVDYHQIRDLLGKYDKDRKGYLSESDFLTFYTEACFSKANAVLGNLRNLNYNEQLLPVDENYEPEPEELARDYIMQQHEFVSDLYNMTEKIPSLAELSWGILSRLPPLPSIIKRITSLAGAQDAQDTNWDAILESQSTFKTLYNLFIVDFLLEDTQIEGEDNPLDGLIQEDSASFKKKWRHDFIIRGGFQYLFNVLKKYISQGTASQHDTLLLSFILRSVKTYLLASVTLLKPDIYPCVAFIGSSSTDFTTLINLKKQRLQTVPEGKQASTSTAPLESTAVAVGPPTKEEATKQDKQAEALKETAEFIDFREDFRQTSDHGIKSINVEETVRFLVRLCETVLSKTENLHFEELAIVEISLNIIFCCILDDLDLLRRLTSTNEIHLLSENSSFRQAGYSDFLSFMIAGMLNKRGALIVKYFDNAFKVLLHEAESKEVQTVLVKVVFENSLKEGLPLRNTSKHIELAAQLLENICSEQKDAKILLSKSDLNTLVDLDTLFFEIFERVFRVKAQSRDELYYEIELLSNSFKILEKVLTIEPSLKKKLVEKEVIQRLFSDCLFNSPEGEEEKKELVCKSYFARSAAFELLAEACKGCPQNMLALYRKGLQKLSENLPKINAWGYTANTSRKSDLGFVGIHNPSCICYMNAMLQQFYMTPAFRYGILMADDAQAPDMVEVEEKVFDDNVFHQLQRMFAFLDKSDRRDYSPIEFCLSYKDFAGQRVDIRVQQDTKEFLDVIFDKLENALKPSPFKNLLFDVYGGKQISEIECSNCGNTRTNEQVFYNLSLEVKNLKNINEGIEKLITEDYISDYKCEACQKKCDVIKRTFLKECPNVLIVHLQRIIFDLDVLMNVKINSWYEFQNKMDLKNYTWENYVSNKPGAAKDAEEASTEKTDETDLKYQDSDINPNITEDPPQAAPQKPTESFEYNLAGVIVHLGSADMGHYYSYININRGDPGRPKMYAALT
jgi:ubiquitin carboxyl-terminal hydrolase 34